MSVHLVPVRDVIAHRLIGEGVGRCPCAPWFVFLDPVSGEAYDRGPLVVHERLGEAPTTLTEDAWRVVDADA